jgi:two-component system, LuxR family, response regulator FixJ
LSDECQKCMPVYIVEDQPELRSLLKRSLERASYEAREFSCGESFLEACGNLPPGCILLDNRLPGASGVDLLPEIRKRSPLSQIIIISGNVDMPTALRSLKLGAADVLQKPIRMQALLEVIERAAESIHASS